VIELLPRPARAYSDTMAAAVGSTPPRPSPARKRSRPKTSGEDAAAHSAVNSEKIVTLSRMLLRRPITSVMVPIVSAPSIIPIARTR
jgi:hypothetical protein